MSQPPPYGAWPDPQQPWQTDQPDPQQPWVTDRPPGEVPTQMAYPAAPYPAASYSAPAAAAPPGYGYPGGYPYPAAVPTNGLAIASLVCSLASLLVVISAPVGAILGHIARRQIRERGEQGEGMALAGIIIGWIFTGLYGLCCVGYFGILGFAISQDPSSF